MHFETMIDPIGATKWVFVRRRGRSHFITVRVPSVLREVVGLDQIDHAFDPDDQAERALTMRLAHDLWDEFLSDSRLRKLSARDCKILTQARAKLYLQPLDVGILAGFGTASSFGEYELEGSVISQSDLFRLSATLSLDPETNFGLRPSDLGFVDDPERQKEFDAPPPVWLINPAFSPDGAGLPALRAAIQRYEPILHLPGLRAVVFRAWRGFVEAAQRVVRELINNDPGPPGWVPHYLDPRIADYVMPILSPRADGAQTPPPDRATFLAAKKAFKMSTADLYAFQKAFHAALPRIP